MDTPSWFAKGQELSSQAKEALRLWEQVAKPSGPQPYFDNGTASVFDHTTADYNDANAWWLSELSRLVYTRVKPEIFLSGASPVRFEYLDQVNIEQVESFYSAGSHVGLFRLKRTVGGRPVLVVCFRGTNNLLQWILNLTVLGGPWYDENPEDPASVHQGFKYIFDKLWPQVEELVSKFNGPVFYAGHSLGGALALMAAVRRKPVALYTFGAPRVGNQAFAELADDIKHHRIIYNHDIVTTLPLTTGVRSGIIYEHTGTARYLMSDGKMLVDPSAEELGSIPPGPTDNSLRLITQAFNDQDGAAPPGPLLDHSPYNYTQALAQRLQKPSPVAANPPQPKS